MHAKIVRESAYSACLSRGVRKSGDQLYTHRGFHSGSPKNERPESNVTDVSPRRGACVVVVVVVVVGVGFLVVALARVVVVVVVVVVAAKSSSSSCCPLMTT